MLESFAHIAVGNCLGRGREYGSRVASEPSMPRVWNGVAGDPVAPFRVCGVLEAAQLALQQTKAFRFAAFGRIIFDALAAELGVGRTTRTRVPFRPCLRPAMQ